MTTMKTGKSFIYLYPELDILAFEISVNSYGFKISREKEFRKRFKTANDEQKITIEAEYKAEAIKEFGEVYKRTLNLCIDQRYRQKGFEIVYALLDGSPISEVIVLQDNDRVINVGMDAKTHRTKVKGKYPYPDTDYILAQLGKPRILRVGGFHMWDCVEKVAKRAYEKRIDVLVDEDLTEFFGFQIKRPKFKIDSYPNYDPKNLGGGNMFEEFIRARKGKPWLWQDY